MQAQFAKAPSCPTCSNRMVFLKGIPRVGSLPELHTYRCEECGVRKTETKVARDEVPRPKPDLYSVKPPSSLLH
jgi:C4-type Zn-finger protein